MESNTSFGANSKTSFGAAVDPADRRTITLTDWVLIYCSIRRKDILDDSYIVVREGSWRSNRTLYIQAFADGVDPKLFAADLKSEFERRGLECRCVVRVGAPKIYEALEFRYWETGNKFDPFAVDGLFIA